MQNKHLLIFIAIGLACSSTKAQKPFLFSNANSITMPRSQSVDVTRELCGWQNQINRTDAECSYQSFSCTVQYEQSFRANRIAECIFGNSLSFNNSLHTFNDNEDAILNISGSHVTTRGVEDWLADYFGLPTDFQSQVLFKPTIQNAIFDFNFYAGLDSWKKGTFFRIHIPLVWTKWQLNACEAVSAPGTNSYDPGYMNATPDIPFNAVGPVCPIGISNQTLIKSFLVATDGFHGTFGDVTQDFKFGIIGDNANHTNKSHNRVGVSDIELAVGWNFLRDENYHVGLELRGSLPTGNKPDPRYLFYPLIGNGHYWTLGAGLTSHCILWRSCDDTSNFGLWFDVNLVHFFQSCQKRSFDFKNKPNSRYMLLEKLDEPVFNLFSSTSDDATEPGTMPAAQYRGAGNLLHAINITTRDILSSFSWQSDLVIKFAYQIEQFQCDIGFSAWSRSAERVCPQNGIPGELYAVKGDAYLYGYAPEANTAGLASGFPVPLSATENGADITGGFNFYGQQLQGTQAQQNFMVDNAQFAQDVMGPSGVGDVLLTVPVPAGGTCDAAQTKTSNAPLFISTTDIDFHGLQDAFTHKAFVFLSYEGNAERQVVPFGGIGIGFDIAPGIGSAYAFTDCDEDDRGCGISQWIIWAKVGISY